VLLTIKFLGNLRWEEVIGEEKKKACQVEIPARDLHLKVFVKIR